MEDVFRPFCYICRTQMPNLLALTVHFQQHVEEARNRPTPHYVTSHIESLSADDSDDGAEATTTSNTTHAVSSTSSSSSATALPCDIDFCEMRFRTRDALRLHQQTVHGVSSRAIKSEAQFTPPWPKIRKRKNASTGDAPAGSSNTTTSTNRTPGTRKRSAHACTHCKMTFSSSSDLLVHKTNAHLQQQQNQQTPPRTDTAHQPSQTTQWYRCSLCPKTLFPDLTLFEAHVNRSHVKRK